MLTNKKGERTIQINKKADIAVQQLLSRQEYLVVQGNDLAKALGGLSSLQHKILDFCFSFVTKDSKVNDVYQTTAGDIIKHFGWSKTGENYIRIAETFKFLNENTAIYLPTVRENGSKGILMTQLFSKIGIFQDGEIEFKFSEDVAPLVFDLREHFYSFKLAELVNIKGKYALIFLKMWESHRRGKEKYTTITGSFEEWQKWFLGDKKMTPSQFTNNVIKRGCNELESKIPVEFKITPVKNNRKLVGYEMLIIDTSIKDIGG